MAFKYVLGGVVLSVLLLVPAMARAESAQEAFTKGQEMLAKGDFAGAVEWLGVAAKADATNQDYVKRYAVARRVVDFRKRLDTEQDPKQWEAVARGLRSFYLREKIYPEALALAQRMHEKLKTTASAYFLAETQLAMDENDDGLKTLLAIPADKVTPASQSLLAIAYMETGKPDQAKDVLSKLTVPANAGPGVKLIAARSYAKAGMNDKAIESLTAFFESVPAAELPIMKKSAQSIPEFAGLAKTPEFAKALETQSKMKESECSGGSDCSTCPLGAKCPSAGADKTAAEKK